MTFKSYERINTSDPIQKMNRKKDKYTPLQRQRSIGRTTHLRREIHKHSRNQMVKLSNGAGSTAGITLTSLPSATT